MAEAVLDASAVLAFLRGEPGADDVERTMPRSLVSAVNVSEIVSKLVERGVEGSMAVGIVRGLPFDIVSHDADLAYQTGVLRRETAKIGLSIGDRACLAVGLQYGLPVLTTDKVWAKLSFDVEVRVLR